MLNATSSADGPGVGAGVSLRTIWHVDADPTYDIPRTREENRLVAVRTLSGVGELFYKGESVPQEVPAGSLVVFEFRDIARYRCPGKRWHFWWFEFTSSSALPCNFGRVMKIQSSPGDKSMFREVFTALRRNDDTERAFASAGFAMLLHRWLVSWGGRKPVAPHAATVRKTIDQMHDRLESGWTVGEMAREAHMSERRFRQVFHGETGNSPKSFFERMRLEKGRQLLQLGIYSVKQVSEQLGFSSQFHFSRAFRNALGIPPSSVR